MGSAERQHSLRGGLQRCLLGFLHVCTQMEPQTSLPLSGTLFFLLMVQRQKVLIAQGRVGLTSEVSTMEMPTSPWLPQTELFPHSVCRLLQTTALYHVALSTCPTVLSMLGHPTPTRLLKPSVDMAKATQFSEPTLAPMQPHCPTLSPRSWGLSTVCLASFLRTLSKDSL